MGVENIAGVAQGRLGYLAAFANSVDGKTHIIEAVQAIENAEDIDAVFRG